MKILSKNYEKIKFDSLQEVYVYLYFKELKENGFIENIEVYPASFLLFEKNKEFGLRQHIYTPDLKVVWCNKAIGVFTSNKVSDLKKRKGKIPFYANSELESFIEVKPDYKAFSTEATSINIKWTLQIHRRYVQVVKPLKLFEATFTPQRFLFCDNKITQKRKLKFHPKTLEEYKI